MASLPVIDGQKADSPAITQWLDEMGMHWHENMYISKMMKPAVMDRVKNFKFDANDVLVSTYPRSGTTWTLELTWLILNGADFEQAKAIERTERARFIEFTTRGQDIPEIEHLEKTPPPRLIKTHFPPQCFEPKRTEVGFKTIVVMRNICDVIVSQFHFVKNLFNFKGTWDDFFELFKSGRMLYGSWADHCMKCWKLRDDPNVLILKYEDMKKDPFDAVRTIASFCSKTLSEDQVKAIAEFSDISKMKVRHLESNMVKNDPKQRSFIREGTVGDGDKWFTEEQLEYVKEYLQRTIEREGLFMDMYTCQSR